METITIQKITYHIESNCYGGDLMLISDKQDVRIVGGYDALERLAISRLQSRTGREELERYQIDYEMEITLKEFIMDNFLFGDVTIHDAEDSATESALAIISQPRLEKLKWSLALMQTKLDAPSEDLKWLAARVDGAMKVKADPALLPY